MGGTACIFTVSGKQVDLLNPDPATIDITDIAAGLSKICRFSGQMTRFYSVAEHSVLVARHLLKTNRMVSVQAVRAALLHDASEAYMGDVTKPIKYRLPEYQLMEDRMFEAISRAFDLPCPLDDIWKEIKRCDSAVCRLEAKHLVNADEDLWCWNGIECAQFDLHCYSPEGAESAFLNYCENLVVLDGISALQAEHVSSSGCR
jgi:hypothetical protein